MHIHILGICGSFMAGLAVLAKGLGYKVTGSDLAAHPPMSTQLEAAGIQVFAGYAASHVEPTPDLVIIGNALSRGNAEVEAVLDRGLRYTSGAQWIGEQVLQGRSVIAVAGTHGKTTTASMLAWILAHSGIDAGFLIGGVPLNFGVSARLGSASLFVIEADEYDTAFFDKRSKFLHYRPRTAILNNLEFDHADIFADVRAIQLQFHHFVRTIPGCGLLIVNGQDVNLRTVLDMGCWTAVEYFSAADGWTAQPLKADGSGFRVLSAGHPQGEVHWRLCGEHNMLNALAAVAAARRAGVPTASALAALSRFESVRRRLELRGVVRGISVYDDFAHHPTAIAATLQALRAHVSRGRIFAVLELRSNSMRMGVHQRTLPAALTAADEVRLLRSSDLNWDPASLAAAVGERARVLPSVEAIVEGLAQELRANDHVLIMSNGDFGAIHERLLARLREDT
jgi:UDP-N-acetylmuramate: L-alanyl-gamma-D-glutamyl-meso-diaminopimelate ligase